MNRGTLILLLLFTGLILTLSCGAPSSVTTVPGQNADNSITTTSETTIEPVAKMTDPNRPDVGVNILIVSEGELLLKRQTWSDYHFTGFGTTLYRGDLLKVTEGSLAKILCDNLVLWSVPSGPAPSGLNGCPRPAEPILTRRGIKIASTRSSDPNVPYIISPRSTKLLSNTPTFRWNASTGAISYTVSIEGDHQNWVYPEVLTDTKLVYPDELTLQPDTSYLLVIEDNLGRSSKDEGRVGLEFMILSNNEAEVIEEQQKHIVELNLPDIGRKFAIAQLNVSHGLIAETIEILEEIIKENKGTTAVYLTLADLYAQINLLKLAEVHYLDAIRLAEAENNVESLANAQAGLAHVYVNLGKLEEAQYRFTKAQVGYETLGDIEQVNEIMRRLKELQ